MTREEAIAIYHQGPAVVADTLVAMATRIGELEGQRAKNSRNSSMQAALQRRLQEACPEKPAQKIGTENGRPARA